KTRAVLIGEITKQEVNRSYRTCRTYFLHCLNIVVQRELKRMRAHAERRDLAIALVCNPALDQLRAEYVTLEQEVVIGFQRLQRIIERTRQSRHILQFFR